MSLLPAGLTRSERRAAIKRLEKENAAASPVMMPIHSFFWPQSRRDGDSVLVGMWKSNRFLAQLFGEKGQLRLSVNRTSVDSQGDRWLDGITWDQLQQVKTECGFGDCWAVEIYPPTSSLVDVANIRHLWLLREAPPYAWKKP